MIVGRASEFPGSVVIEISKTGAILTGVRTCVAKSCSMIGDVAFPQPLLAAKAC
jgi:hypothetical protein